MYSGFPTQLTKTQSSSPSLGLPNTTFKLDYGYHLCATYNEKSRSYAPNKDFYL